MIECENLVKIYKTIDTEVLALQGLELTVDSDKRTLGEVAAHELCRAAPCDYVEEISLTLGAGFDIAAIYSDAERGHGNAGISGFELRVGNKTTHEYNSVNHKKSFRSGSKPSKNCIRS